MVYVIFGMVVFTQLALVCNHYFIPCVELICEDLKIPQVSELLGGKHSKVGFEAGSNKCAFSLFD